MKPPSIIHQDNNVLFFKTTIGTNVYLTKSNGNIVTLSKNKRVDITFNKDDVKVIVDWLIEQKMYNQQFKIME